MYKSAGYVFTLTTRDRDTCKRKRTQASTGYASLEWLTRIGKRVISNDVWQHGISRDIKRAMDSNKKKGSKMAAALKSARVRLVIEYCERHGITIENGTEFAFFSDSNRITTRHGCSIEVWLYSMLHELGHWAIDKRVASVQQQNYTEHDLHTARTRTQRQCAAMYILDEETQAWHKGLEIASAIGIKINKTTYGKYAAACYAHYVRFLAPLMS